MTTQTACPNCITAFSKPKGSRADEYAMRISTVLTCANKCACEQVSVSSYSPSPVLNTEDVAACASHPHHSDKNGNVTHKVFDRAFTQGLSVTRLAVAKGGIEKAISTCVAIDERKTDRDYMGVVVLKVEDVRQIFFDRCKSRAFSVYDTASKTNDAHADVVGSKYFGSTEKLPKLDQLARTKVQVALSKKMDPVLASRQL